LKGIARFYKTKAAFEILMPPVASHRSGALDGYWVFWRFQAINLQATMRLINYMQHSVGTNHSVSFVLEQEFGSSQRKMEEAFKASGSRNGLVALKESI
jgi:hypothetical protein